MIASLKGIVQAKTADTAVIDVQGVGLEVQVGLQTLSRMPETGREAILYTYMHVREDAIVLFGFDNMEDKKMFLRLIGVSGVGPKVAMNILSAMPARDLAIALVAGDSRAIARVPGIGRKTAERLILELQEKVDNSFITGNDTPSATPVRGDTVAEDGIAALIALGYSASEAAKAVQQNRSNCNTVEDLIRASLLGFNKGML